VRRLFILSVLRYMRYVRHGDVAEPCIVEVLAQIALEDGLVETVVARANLVAAEPSGEATRIKRLAAQI
jgi:hypothetical protein